MNAKEALDQCQKWGTNPVIDSRDGTVWVSVGVSAHSEKPGDTWEANLVQAVEMARTQLAGKV